MKRMKGSFRCLPSSVLNMLLYTYYKYFLIEYFRVFIFPWSIESCAQRYEISLFPCYLTFTCEMNILNKPRRGHNFAYTSAFTPPLNGLDARFHHNLFDCVNIRDGRLNIFFMEQKLIRKWRQANKLALLWLFGTLNGN